MTDNSQYYDALETRSQDERSVDQLAKLRAHIRHAQNNSSANRELLGHIEADSITSFESLAMLPITRKSALIEAQQAHKPFGGYASLPVGQMKKVFASPGPIYEPEGHCKDYWRMSRALYAAGIRAQDLVHNTFSYHFTPAGSLVESAAEAIGAVVIPAGTGQTELQVTTITDLKPTAYVGTPSFLRIIIDKAAELKLSVASIRNALVSGEALPPSLRQLINDAGINVQQAYATADLGLIAYESSAMEGLIVDEGAIVELVRPGTGTLVSEGEVGEVVVTTFNSHYPLIRFATGDLSAALPGTSPCGRTNVRIKGWMGRADQTTKIKGMFVHPQQVDKICQRHSEIIKARLVVTNPDNVDSFSLQCECSSNSAVLIDEIQNSIRDVTKLRGAVEIVEPGSLANDGKVIDDCRVFE